MDSYFYDFFYLTESKILELQPLFARLLPPQSPPSCCLLAKMCVSLSVAKGVRGVGSGRFGPQGGRAGRGVRHEGASFAFIALEFVFFDQTDLPYCRCGRCPGTCATSSICPTGCRTTTSCTRATDLRCPPSQPASGLFSEFTPKLETSGRICLVPTGFYFRF